MTTRTGATWSALEAHDYALADITGLACDADTAWRLAVTGSDATGRHRLWSASYDGAWSPLLEITRADAGSGVTFDAPFLRLADVPRLTVVERYTGAGGYRRPLMFSALADTPYDANSWADPVPFPADAPYGVAIAGPPTPSGSARPTPSGTPPSTRRPTTSPPTSSRSPCESRPAAARSPSPSATTTPATTTSATPTPPSARARSSA